MQQINDLHTRIVVKMQNAWGDETTRQAVNAYNTARLVGNTIGVASAKSGIYSAALATAPVVFDDYTDLLKIDGVNSDNSLILKNANNTQIALIGVKIDVTKANKIVETSLVNREGKVKEFIQADDYTITVKGNLYGDRNKFPLEALQQLLEVLRPNQSMEVASPYLEAFGICKVVLKQAQFNQSNLRHFNVMPFELTLLSDTDYNFLIEEE